MTSSYDIRVKNELVERESEFVERLFSEVSKVVVGQREMVERVFMGLICGGPSVQPCRRPDSGTVHCRRGR